MNSDKYVEYLTNIEIFLNSDKAYQFNSNYFVDILIGTINNENK